MVRLLDFGVSEQHLDDLQGSVRCWHKELFGWLEAAKGCDMPTAVLRLYLTAETKFSCQKVKICI